MTTTYPTITHFGARKAQSFIFFASILLFIAPPLFIHLFAKGVNTLPAVSWPTVSVGFTLVIALVTYFQGVYYSALDVQDSVHWVKTTSELLALVLMLAANVVVFLLIYPSGKESPDLAANIAAALALLSIGFLIFFAAEKRVPAGMVICKGDKIYMEGQKFDFFPFFGWEAVHVCYDRETIAEVSQTIICQGVSYHLQYTLFLRVEKGVKFDCTPLALVEALLVADAAAVKQLLANAAATREELIDALLGAKELQVGDVTLPIYQPDLAIRKLEPEAQVS